MGFLPEHSDELLPFFICCVFFPSACILLIFFVLVQSDIKKNQKPVERQQIVEIETEKEKKNGMSPIFKAYLFKRAMFSGFPK